MLVKFHKDRLNEKLGDQSIEASEADKLFWDVIVNITGDAK